MFKGFKNALRGGIGTVAEKSQDIASNVVNDQEFSTTAIKDKLKETTKRTYKEGKLLYKEGAHEIRDKVGDENVDKVQTTTKDVAHNIKHYGAFGEDVLGYSDPQKELRKAVKAKEKAAKKAKKAKKKKGEKPEDLFDPANLAKYKQELEEKRKLASLAAPVSPGVTDTSKSPTSPVEPSSPTFDQPQKPASAVDKWSDDGSDEFDFGMQETKQEKGESGQTQAAAAEPEPENDWARFQAMTSGVDAIVKQKKDNLDSLKVTSYYQRKKTQDEIEEDARLARPKNLVGARKKRWVDLDEEGFEERDGVLNEEVSDGDMSEEDFEEVEPEPIEPEKEPSDFVVTPEGEEAAAEEDGKKDEEEEEEEEDFFNTEFVNEQLAVLDMKLNEIPDSPVDEGPDVFDTNYASDIVKKAEKERIKQEKAENDKVKFGYISAAADVLTGKAAAVDNTAVDHTRKAEAADKKSEPEGPTIVRKRRRRGDPLPEPEPVPVVEEASKEDKPKVASPSAPESPTSENEKKLAEGEDEEIAFSEQKPEEQPPEQEEEEEDDPFDAAFDELAQESLKKVNIDELTAELYNDDLFDTTAADEVLNLASLTNVKAEEEKEEIVLDTFDDDRDPFDTSAFEHITKDFEEDLEFESLAKRDPNETSGSVAFDAGPDPFETVEKQIEDNQREEANAGWAAFDQVKRKKPSRPPKPPPPRPPRPAARPNPPAVSIDYASGRNTPAVIIKAPSTESVRSWNCTQSETLIIKNNIEALDASQIENEDEIDPFDTTEYEGLVKELKGQTEDPFDTSKVENLEPSKTELKLIEQELIGEKKEEEAEDNKDPFDTEFAEKVVPKEKEPEDPFDTGEPEPKDEEEEEDFDPFDTSVVEKVIPVRKPKVSSKSTISIEDEDFDPSKAFSTSPKSPAPPVRPTALPKKLEDDPFATREGSAPSCPPPVAPRKVRPEHQVVLTGRVRPKTAAQIAAEKAALQKQVATVESDDDFDPRADTPPTPKPKTPESPDPFDTDGVDPFDTSAVQIEE